jgi:internalin A
MKHNSLATVAAILTALLVVRASCLFSVSAAADSPQADAIARIEALGGRVVCDAAGLPREADLTGGRACAADADLGPLFELTTLKSVKLAGGGITSTSVQRLAALGELAELHLTDVSLADDDLARLAGLKNLETLVIRRGGKLTDAGLPALRQMPKLSKLGLLEVGITDHGLELLAGLPRLVMLDLRGCSEISNAGLTRLAALHNLKTLRLGGQRIDDRSLAICGRMVSLASLTVEEAAVGGEGLKQLAGLELEELNLSRCYAIDDESLGNLARLKTLRRLSLRGIPISGAGLARLGGLESLEDLRLNETGVDDDALAHLLQLPLKKTLRRLELRQTLISDAAADCLAQLDGLQYLDVGETGMSAEAARRLCSTLPKCKLVR